MIKNVSSKTISLGPKRDPRMTQEQIGSHSLGVMAGDLRSRGRGFESYLAPYSGWTCFHIGILL